MTDQTPAWVHAADQAHALGGDATFTTTTPPVEPTTSWVDVAGVLILLMLIAIAPAIVIATWRALL